MSELSESEGAKAIIYLQSMAGITETEKDAVRYWRTFTDEEKQKTITAYRKYSPPRVRAAAEPKLRAYLARN